MLFLHRKSTHWPPGFQSMLRAVLHAQSTKRRFFSPIPPTASASTMACFPIEQLPLALQQQVVLALPPRSCFTLRQCSHAMMRLVDSSVSTSLQLAGPGHGIQAVASVLQLCQDQLRGLVVSDAALAPPLNGLALPCLTRLACCVCDADLLQAVSAASPQLRALELRLPPSEAASREDPGATLSQRCWPGLTGLTRLQLDRRCHALLARSPPLCGFVGSLTSLQALLLDAARPTTFPVKAQRCELQDAQWQGAIQPLTALTRLSLGFVALSNGSQQHQEGEVEDAALPAADAPSAGAAWPAGTLAHLQELRLCGCDGLDAFDSWVLGWVGGCTALTALDVAFCSAAEVDFEVLGCLGHLCHLALHHYSDELINSSQLAPLSACSRLTSLRLDSLVVERGHCSSNNTAAGNKAAATEGAEGGGAGAAAGAVLLPQLTSLVKLRAGLLCQAPVATLAPGLTQLRDADYDLAALELPSSFVDESPPAGHEALAGLSGLALLGVNIFGLVRHAKQSYSSLTQHSRLCELHIDMIGNLGESHLSPGGLPLLPCLTRLVMSLTVKEGRNVAKSYSTREDALLWKNQTSLTHMTLRGTKLLGGFLVHPDLLQLLAARLTSLRCLELARCRDLTPAELGAVVGSRAARRVLVVACPGVSDRDCLRLESAAGGAVTIDCV